MQLLHIGLRCEFDLHVDVGIIIDSSQWCINVMTALLGEMVQFYIGTLDTFGVTDLYSNPTLFGKRLLNSGGLEFTFSYILGDRSIMEGLWLASIPQ